MNGYEGGAMPPSVDELLQYVINNGMIDLPNIEKQINMSTREKYLKQHDHKIWLGNDGKWCTYLTDYSKPNNRGLCKRRTKEQVEEAIISYWRQRENNPTIDEVFDEWNSRRLARQQIKKITYDINKDTYKRFYSTFGKNRIKDITELQWEDFLCDTVSGRKITSKCFANLKSITKGFLKRAKKRGLISMDVEHFFLELDVSDVDFKKQIINDDKEIFYDDEIEKIMDYIKNHIDNKNLGIALMFVTGIRVGELVVLKHSDFNGTTFNICREQTRHKGEDGHGVIYEVSDYPKTPAGFRTVIVPKDQVWIINKLRTINPFGEYIFIDSKGNIMDTDKIRKRLYFICDKVGIPRRSPHKIRKTYGSILLDNGIDNKLIEQQMGHTDISCTERFYHRNRRRNSQRQIIIDSIPEFAAK